MALENHQLVTEDRQLDVAVQIVRGAGDQPHHTTQQEIQQSEQHVPTSHDMKEGRSYERTGRGADRRFVCPTTYPDTGRFAFSSGTGTPSTRGASMRSLRATTSRSSSPRSGLRGPTPPSSDGCERQDRVFGLDASTRSTSSRTGAPRVRRPLQREAAAPRARPANA
jgi:hypothetical protein